MFALVYRLADNGLDRIHLKHGGRPFDSREDAEVYLEEFKREHEPHSIGVVELVPVTKG